MVKIKYNMNNRICKEKRVKFMKRIVTIQDISCLGKCSLTVALPIISAMGVETAIIPTAVLSTHTMFSRFTVKDLTDQIAPVTEHWKEENLDFDAIYTGYLGSFEQIDLMKDMFDKFRTDSNIIFVDPAMADNGKLYPAFDEAFAKGWITKVITTNLIYQSEELLSRPYYETADMAKYLALLIDALNHDGSISEYLNPYNRIQKLLQKYGKR